LGIFKIKNTKNSCQTGLGEFEWDHFIRRVVGKFILVQKIEAATVIAENPAKIQHERGIVTNCATVHSQNCRENELGSNVATHQR
jgi:hypothetical protein